MKVLATAAAALAALLLAGPTSAATFSANLTVNAYSGGGSGGTELDVSNVANPLTFDLDVGEWEYKHLFTLTVDDPNGIDHSTDENANPISVLFDFFEPSNGNTTVTGETQGHLISGPDYLTVEWDNSSTPIDVGGYKLLITLLDTTINETCIYYYSGHCKKYGGSAHIKGKFRLKDGPNPIPLPPAVPLFATGLAVIGWVGVRRRRAATRA